MSYNFHDSQKIAGRIMPIREFSNQPGIDEDAAQVMCEAYAKVVSVLRERRLRVENSVAGRVARLVIDGERDADQIANTVLEAFSPKA